MPYFVIRLTVEPQDGYVLGISDRVEPRYLPYAVGHEFVEFTEVGIDSPNGCVQALDEELSLVPEDIKPEYLQMRIEFFQNLIPYCSRQPEFYTEADLNQFRQNLSRLEGLVREVAHLL